MKKMILVMLIFLSANLFGADKAQCENLFRSAIFNFYLENSCKFDKRVSSAMRKKFGDENCTELFNDNDMKKLNSEVLGDSYTKMNKVGRDKFCKNNQASYDALASH